MKILKRIFVIAILIAIVFLISYLVYTIGRIRIPLVVYTAWVCV